MKQIKKTSTMQINDTVPVAKKVKDPVRLEPFNTNIFPNNKNWLNAAIYNTNANSASFLPYKAACCTYSSFAPKMDEFFIIKPFHTSIDLNICSSLLCFQKLRLQIKVPPSN